MSDGIAEVIHLENAFGTVTDRRVIYFRSKGWFSGGSKKVIPLQSVTSVRLEFSRHLLLGVLLLLMRLGLLAGHGVLPITGGVAIAFAVLLLWGSPTVVVNAAGSWLNREKGWPWQRIEAEAFAEALRARLFHDKKFGQRSIHPAASAS
jgi:hypothetical protein